MSSHFHTNQAIPVYLTCKAINAEHALITDQISLLRDIFEFKIKKYTEKQLLFLKACLTLQHTIEEKSADSLHYQLFLIEERLKKIQEIKNPN